MPATTRMLSGAYNLLMGVALGTLLTGAGAVAYRRGRGDRSYPSLPGHWLLLFGIAAALADGLAIVVYRFLLAAWFPPDTYLSVYWLAYRLARNGPDLPGMFHQCVGWGLGTVIALMFLWSLRRQLNRAWLAVFFAFFLAAGVLSVGAIVTTMGAFRPFRRVWTPRVVSSCNPSLRRIHPPVYRHDLAGPRGAISSPGPRPTVCTGPESWRG